jgi:ribosome-binding factor A
MADRRRLLRLNSLLKEVISEVIHGNVKNKLIIGKLITVTSVDITNDLHHAKVHVSIIASEEEKKGIMDALLSAAGFISVNASKKVVMHHFPELTFILDDSVEKHMRIDDILLKIQDEKKVRTDNDTEEEV